MVVHFFCKIISCWCFDIIKKIKEEHQNPIWEHILASNYCPYCGNKLSETVDTDKESEKS